MQKTFRYFVYFGIGFCFLFYTAFVGAQVGSIVLCDNANRESIALCANASVLVIASGVVNVLTDSYFLILPIPQVLQLKLSRWRKYALLSIFMTESM